ncbi:rhomboid family intramembrane serine protease [Mycobacterium kubicae]|uniref:Rhomboid family intramembrane serine protease n=1 Tax=Mycobacterium kubicae TaxID=120959 RepID=A0AAX1J9Z1_9MYCO|nr:rhomboid family intramembrane serine protease [Mycobacterium kubicae]MCV7093750.1 rhomboid family intramembrane serine protease [Mycobacterium kubicae]OBF19217.1 rhomboid family intramembrane serine protease [Mycobacterium kubicae]ORW00763.1 rhomboid family intramembrane serine protease [Mycobacterium kubicae]QNI10097.1 rhomboid family intramembrane serine protease [Mycobacterium kubicae]QPI38299.1 rhomboid family intramembrane serine protease [Mycobacterium kubicae]
MQGVNPPQSPAEAPTCYRHPGRQTYVRCTRCERPICGDCMRSAAVGHQCVECVHAGARTIRQPRTRFGGRQRSATPVVTYVLIAINVLAFVAELTSVDVQKQLVLWPPGVASGQFYRLVTSAFLHYGGPHLLLNMWALYVVGRPLEMWLGRIRFGALYALSGLGGSVLVYLLSPLNTATAGASGAVFGLFGATFVVAKRLTLDVRGVVAVIVVNLAFTFVVPAVSSQLISWQAHVGGLVTGGLVGAAYVYAPRQHRNAIQAAVTVMASALFVALIWWRTVDLLTGALA